MKTKQKERRKKYPKIGNNLRDLLLRQVETVVDGKVAEYFGEFYRYNSYTNTERIGIATKLLNKLKSL